MLIAVLDFKTSLRVLLVLQWCDFSLFFCPCELFIIEKIVRYSTSGVVSAIKLDLVVLWGRGDEGGKKKFGKNGNFYRNPVSTKSIFL